MRVRPTKETIVESRIENPYEIHPVSFRAEPDFQGFMKDKERKQFLHLKEQSIRWLVLYKGQQL
ncbi:hypothetical protein [Runella sp.]|uniref:hypothetical protein n=1 Tax=Runella sp. TaxID=1960881 RepID=UPI00261CF6F0|nr:hypothetical protein [Runella sp.]